MSCTNCNTEGYNSASASQIAEAYADALTAETSRVSVAKKREKTCTGCEHNTALSGVFRILANTIMPAALAKRHKAVAMRACNLCKCPLAGKIYVQTGDDNQGGCPDNRWEV